MLCHSQNICLKNTSHLGYLSLLCHHHVQVRVWATISSELALQGAGVRTYCSLQCCTSFGLAHPWGRVTFQTKKARSGRTLDMKTELTDSSLTAHLLLILGAVFFFSWTPSTPWNGQGEPAFAVFIQRSKDSWDWWCLRPVQKQPPSRALPGHGFWFSMADFSSQGWELSSVAHKRQCCSHTI